MADKTLVVSGLIGNGIPVGEVGTGVERFKVEIAPAYQFQRSDLTVNWPVPATFTTDTGSISIPGLAESDVAADRVTWQIRVSFLDRRNQVVGGGQAVTFQFPTGGGSTVRFPDQVNLVDLVVDPEYGPTWAAQAEAARDEAVAAAAQAAGAARIVYHGSNNAVTRPVTANTVIWVGSVYPLNAILGDLVPDVTIPVDPPDVLLSDDYNRADGAVGASPTGGLTLTVTGTATPAIVSNQLSASAATGTAYATYDVGVANGVFKIKLGNRQSAAGFGIPIRFASTTNHLLLCRVSSGTQNWRLIKRVASTTAVDVYVSSAPMTAGDTFEITLNGTAISITLNGSAFWSGTVTDHATNTKFGTMFTSVDIAGATSFDNISFTELA